MKRMLSLLILVAMVTTLLVNGIPFFATAEITQIQLAEQIGVARQTYFSGGSEQTRKYLYDKLTAAELVLNTPVVNSSEVTSSYEKLEKALNGFKPISISERITLNGIEYWTSQQLSAMESSGLKAALDESVRAGEAKHSLRLTLESTKGSFFNLPGEDGGYSPFAVDMNAADGLSFSVSAKDYSAVSSIEFYVGTKSSEKDELLSVYNIPVRREGYIYIPWEAFYPEATTPEAVLDLNGGMNRIGFVVNGDAGAEVYISDIHAFVEVIEEDTRTYREVKVNSFDEIRNDGLYKIVDTVSGKVVTFGPLHTSTQYRSESRIAHIEAGQHFSMEENNGNDITQQWQIYKLAKSGKYHIINQGTSAAMTSSFLGLILEVHGELDNTAQKWEVSEENGEFIFQNGNKYLGISDSSPALVTESNATWNIYECITDEWVEVWGDEFNGTSIDRTKWNVANGKVRGDTEPATFRDDPNNVYLKDGNLVIRTVVEEYGGYHATSGYLDTRGLFSSTYGKFEMRAKLTYGNHIWPAFWSMGNLGNWPYNGEIDIMEFDGDGGLGDKEYSHYATNHWFNYDRYRNVAKGLTIQTEGKVPFAEEYHTFAVEWEENQVRTYLDGMLYMSLVLSTDSLRWSFGDNAHYFILNTSTKGPGNNQLYPDMAPEAFFYVDYVRCYKRSSEVAEVPTYDDDIVDHKVVVGTDGWMTAVEASPDGKQVIAAKRNGFHIIDTEYDSIDGYLEVNGCEISDIEYSADGALFAVSDRSGLLNVYNSETKKLVTKFSVPALYISDIAFSADNNYLYFGGSINAETGVDKPLTDPSLYLYRANISTGKVDQTVLVGSNVREAEVSPDGKLLAVGCASGKVGVYDITDDVKLQVEYNDHIHCVRGVTWSPDGKRLATSDEDGRIFVRFIEDGTSLKVSNVSTSTARILSYSPDGTKLLAAGSGESARLFDGENGKLLSVFGGFSQMISSAEWSPDGSRIFLLSGDGLGRIFDSNANYICTIDGRESTCNTFAGATFAADGKKIYAVTYAPFAKTYSWDISEYISDSGEFERVYADAVKEAPEGYSRRDYEVLKAVCEEYKNLARTTSVSNDKYSAAIKKLLAALELKNGKIFGFNPWESSIVSGMSVTNCRSSMREQESPTGISNMLTVFSTRTSWSFKNLIDGVVSCNPFVKDMRDYSGIKIKAYATKAVTKSDILIGYSGEEETIFKYNLGSIGTSATEFTIPFENFVHVSGDEILDLSRLEIIGFECSGKTATGVYYYDLEAYREEGEIPVVEGVVDGEIYDLSKMESLVLSWNVGRGELNGEDVVSGVAVTEAGEYTLCVFNLDKMVKYSFTVVKPILGDIDGDEAITVSDALLCLRYVAGIKIPYSADNADHNADGAVGIDDALSILRTAVGL